ncbi:alpha/beta fold hydrolase [Paraburkholderia dilworthii]|uniref:alpha/beta fold hydrolase n=1 Tax=Paraburkholderia dilworthii TaxID=948106 RepID=UPI0003FB294A|nr:alpha/beta hydrolase [Paraburkholderia dilworthii]
MKAYSLPVDGYSLSVRSVGTDDPHAPVIVAIHGMMESSTVWLPVIEALLDRCRFVLVDLPWNGTQGDQWGRVRSPDAWLEVAVNAFELQPDAFAAHSFGASVLLAFLATSGHPCARRTPSVVVSPFFKADPAEFSWALLRRYIGEFPQFVAESITQRSGGRPIPRDSLPRMVETACDTFGVGNWMEFWRLFARMPSLDMRALTQPTLVITGADDFSSPPADQRALCSAIHRCELRLLPAARHFLLDSHRETVARLVTEFVATHVPGASAPRSFCLPDEHAGLFHQHPHY